MKSMLASLVATLALAYAVTATANTRGRVLIVMSGAHHLDLKDGKRYETGYYLDELAIPLKKMVEAGFTPVFASPNGATPSIDASSKNKMFFNGDAAGLAAALKYVDGFKELKNPKRLSTIVSEGISGYAGIFIPGGHAPVQDLMTDKDLGTILTGFHNAAKPTGLICHSPVTLISTVSNPAAFKQAIINKDYDTATKLAAGWPYAGYRLTGFATGEEELVEGAKSQLGGSMQFYIANALTEAGAHVDAVADWQSNVIEDRELVTGQQPLSADAVGDAFVTKLNATMGAQSSRGR
jgi:putative intracellular protease/amidase